VEKIGADAHVVHDAEAQEKNGDAAQAYK